ncbi:dipeptidylpeptidase [Coemansia sp. RSA 988]|nr:dipeptidylpeptidase [Coemansia sp. RSA 988]
MRLDVGGKGILGHKSKAKNIIKDTVADGRLEVADSFTFSSDGRQIAFVAKKPGVDYAWRTTSYVYLADVDGTAAAPINENGEGASSSPVFSHDGTKLAYLQMKSATYEADRNQIKVYDFGSKSTVSVASDWDRSPANILWADEATLLATYNDWGRRKLAKIDIVTGVVTPIIEKHSVGSMQRIPNTNKLLISYDAFDMPTDLYAVSIGNGYIEQITSLNPQLGNEVYLSSPEDVAFVGADNATIHGFMLHPPDFDAQKKYPLAYVIHGGPQSSFADSWSTRWNLNIFAAAGFVTVAMDFQGSTGYGQDFTDAIRNQWGGKPYESLMLSLQQLLDAHLYIDRDRMVALGASYGGYMINWLNGHTDIFKAFVNHDGVFSLVSTYYSTDELYFPETESEGVPFDREARENYERWSPERFVSEWKTPTLVIHGQKDYRLTISEGLSTFTALRRQGIPARLLYFPDENHWVLKPANSLRWHREVLDWIARWTFSDSDSAIGSIDSKPPAKFVVQGEL